MTENFEFRHDADGKPLWHAPLPNVDFDPGRPYQPDNSPFSVCQRCGEKWPCAEASYDAGPISVTGIMLQDGATDDELLVLAEIDGEWRVVIQTRHQPGMLLSHIVEPLGMRHSKVAPR